MRITSWPPGRPEQQLPEQRPEQQRRQPERQRQQPGQPELQRPGPEQQLPGQLRASWRRRSGRALREQQRERASSSFVDYPKKVKQMESNNLASLSGDR